MKLLVQQASKTIASLKSRPRASDNHLQNLPTGFLGAPSITVSMTNESYIVASTICDTEASKRTGLLQKLSGA